MFAARSRVVGWVEICRRKETLPSARMCDAAAETRRVARGSF